MSDLHMWVVNGLVIVQWQNFYRIDDMESERTGLDFLNHPLALASSYEIAEHIVLLHNDWVDQEKRKDNVSASSKGA